MNRKLITLMGLCGILLCGCNNESTEERFAKAKKEFSTGAYNLSAINLKDIIREEPGFVDARVLLVETYLKTSQFFNAKREVTRILESGAQLDKQVTNAMIERYLLLSFLNQEFSDIENFGNAFPSLQSTTTDVLVHRFSLFIDDSPLHKRAASGPQDALTLALHQLYLGVVDEYTPDREAFNTLQQQKSGIYLPILGQYFLKKGKFSNCISSFNDFISSQFEHPFVSIRLAQCHFNEKQYAESFENAEKILEDYPEQPLANKLAGTILFLNGAASKAEPYLVKAVSANQGDFAAKTYLGTIYLQQGQYEKAYQQLKGVETVYPESHPARKVLAITQMKLGDYERGLDEFVSDSSIKDDSDIAFLAIAAGTALENGDTDSQAQLVSQIASSTVSSTQMEAEKLRLLSQLYSSSNEVDFDFIPNRAPESATLSKVMIGTLFRYAQAEKLHELSNNWLEEDPEHANFAKGTALYLDGKYSSAVNFFTKSQNNDNLLLNTLLVDSYVKSKQLNKATTLLTSLIDDIKNPGLLLDQLFSLNLANSLPQDYVYRKVNELASTSPNYYLLKAKFFILEQNFSSAEQSLDRYKAKSEALPETYWKLNLKSKILSGNAETVEATFDGWISAVPNNVGPIIAKISYLETQGKIKQAHALTQKSMTKYDDDRLALLNVNFLILKGESNEAEKKFDILPAARKETPLGRGIQASFALRRKDYVAAEDILSKAYQNAPSPRSASMMFSALMHQGKQDKAISFLEEHIAYLPSDQVNMRLLADTLINIDLKKARSYYTFMLQVSPENHQLMNNLAWIENELGFKESAKRLIETAVKLQPDNEEYKDTLDSISKP